MIHYGRKAGSFVWLVLFVVAAGLSTSAIAGDRAAASTVGYQFSAVVGSAWCGSQVVSFASSVEGKGLSAYPLAYVDPGSGQLILQMIVAACVGALFYLKRVRVFLRKLVDKWFKKH